MADLLIYPTDQMFLSDALVRDVTVEYADTITLAEELSWAYGLNLEDTITLSAPPSLGIHIKDSTSDTITLSGVPSLCPGLVRSETITLSDIFSRISTYNLETLADTITLAEDPFIARGLPPILLADIMTLSEEISKCPDISVVEHIKLMDFFRKIYGDANFVHQIIPLLKYDPSEIE